MNPKYYQQIFTAKVGTSFNNNFVEMCSAISIVSGNAIPEVVMFENTANIQIRTKYRMIKFKVLILFISFKKLLPLNNVC